MIEPQRHLKQFLLTCNLCMKEGQYEMLPAKNFLTQTRLDI